MIKLVTDNHIHTTASGHAYSTVKEIVEEAARKGIEAVSITDHGPGIPGSSGYMHFLGMNAFPKILLGVRLFPGVELNILNDQGEVDFEARIIKRLNTVMAGIHPHCYQGNDQDADYHTRAFLRTMDNPHVKIIVHPGDPRYPFDIEQVVRYAAKTGTALEVNDKSVDPTSGTRVGGLPTLKEIIRQCIKYGTYLSFGSDSHLFNDVGDFSYSSQLIDELGIPTELILNTSVEKLESFLNAPKNI